MSKLPLVTVGIPIYNHRDYIKQCLESIVSQTYENVEIIAIDDGSPDNSYLTAKDYLDTSGTSFSYSIRTRPNRGMCNTLNEIARQSSGKYISFIGSDDYWMPEKIADQVAYLEQHQDDVLVHSNSMKVDSVGKELKLIDYSSKDNSGNLFEAFIRRTGGINTPSHLYRTAVFAQIGYYDPDFRFEDTDFWLRLCKHNTVGFINKTHTNYRWHDSNLSNQKNSLSFYFDDLIAIYEKNVDDPALKKYAISRVCIKGIFRSLKALNLTGAKKYTYKLFST